MPLKTARSRRVIEITPGLVTDLRKHKLAAKDTPPGTLLFVRPSGRGYDHRNVGRILARAVVKAKLPSPLPTSTRCGTRTPQR